MTTHKKNKRSPLSLLGILGLTLFPSTVDAQVFDLGPSDPALFDTVINLPTDPNIGDNQTIGAAGANGLSTQLNISGGSVGSNFSANFNSEINISGGSIGDGFGGFSSDVNISGGTIGDNFGAFLGSDVNLFGSDFALDGVPLDNLTIDEAFTVNDRGVTLSGLLVEVTKVT